eukprot:3145891-Pleurochrysis_carterae.AAC.2
MMKTQSLELQIVSMSSTEPSSSLSKNYSRAIASFCANAGVAIGAVEGCVLRALANERAR